MLKFLVLAVYVNIWLTKTTYDTKYVYMLMIYLNIVLQVRNSKDLLIIYIKLKAKVLRTAVILSGAFAKFQKATTDFVVCLSVRMEQIGSHWTGLQEIWFWRTFRKSVEKIQVSLKRVLYMKAYVHLWQYLAEFFLE